MPGGKGTRRWLRRQPAMRKVLLALVPCLLGSIYYFGWRCAAMAVVAAAVGFLAEGLFCRARKEPVSEAVFVTALLFTLVMPPTVPWHVLIVGIAFAVVFSKEVFGGFGRNIFNPALAGRCFVYVCFPVALTGTWAPPAQGPLGALGRWSTVTGPDAITSATPMAHLKAGRIVPTSEPDAATAIPFQIGRDDVVHIKRSSLIRSLAFGRISGTGGVTSALLILIGGVYLFWTKTASRTIILSVVITYAALNAALTWAGVPRFYGPLAPVLGGGFLLGAFFMATDPISSPRTEIGRVIYGIIIGTGTTVIRNFSVFNGGLMFSILLGNMFAPLIDYTVKAWAAAAKAKSSDNASEPANQESPA